MGQDNKIQEKNLSFSRFFMLYIGF